MSTPNNSMEMWGTMIPSGELASTGFGFVRFTKDLLVSRRKAALILVVFGVIFAGLNRKIYARERLKVRALPTTSSPRFLATVDRHFFSRGAAPPARPD